MRRNKAAQAAAFRTALVLLVLMVVVLGQTKDAFADEFEVAASKLNARSSPSVDSPVVFQLARGERVELRRQQGKWAYIASRFGSAWVASRYLLPLGSKVRPGSVSPIGQVSFAPLGGPLVVSLNSRGEIRVSLEAQILTPLGTFSGSLSTDSTPYLEVQCGSETRYFRLSSKPFAVRFLDVHGDVDLSHDGGRSVRITLPCRNHLAEAAAFGSRTSNDNNARFVSAGDGKIFDRQLDLVWTESDNRRDVNWYDAQLYCQSLRLGSYRDWRLPSHTELATIQTRHSNGAYRIHDPFTITTSLHLWSATLASNAALTSEERTELQRQRDVLRRIGAPTSGDRLALTVFANGTQDFSTLPTAIARFSRALCVHDSGADLSRIAEEPPSEIEGEGEIVVTARSSNFSWLDLHFRIDDQAFEYDYEIYRRKVEVARAKLPSGSHELRFNQRFGAEPIPFLVRRDQVTAIEFRRVGLSELAVEIRINGQLVYDGSR